MSEQSPQQTEQNLNISDSILETVQIGGIAGRDQKLTQIQGGVGTLNVFGLVKVDQAPTTTTNTINQQEYRWRRVLLDKVKYFWIDGVLAKSLHKQVLINLGLEEHREFVQNQLSKVQEFPSDSVEVFPAGTTAANIFKGIGAGRTLLILGEPGCGKTVTLLKLAESLIARLENDLSQPLPVVVNLSSWAKQRKSIDDWLVQEIHDIYGASKSLARIWVKQEQLILLLDGLDEVNVKYRNDCVKALNQFIQKHGLTEIVVCCRIGDYENLSERLKLRSAICVQSLTSQQIDQFLEQVGESLFSLKTVLQNNSEIRDFASSPLILSIMGLAYQDCSLDDVQTISKASTFYQHLFDAYIERMLSRRGTTQEFSQQQTKHWLIWMAKKMAKNSQTVFLIERLQPNWLPSRYHRVTYRIMSAFITGATITLTDGLFTILMFWLVFGQGIGLIVGTISGLLWGLIGGLIVGLSGSEIETVETLKWSWQTAKRNFCRGLILGLIIGSILGLITGSIAGLIVMPNVGLISVIEISLIVSLINSLSLGPSFGLLFGIFYGLIGGFKGPTIQNSKTPNQGIWKSIKNSLIIGLVFSLILSLLVGSAYGSILWLDNGLTLVVSSVPIYVILGGLISGGSACFRHFTLRLMLYHMKYIPWNYARFLDYAAERLFLRKVGGGYIFIHRMLLEHFARMELK